MPRAVPGFNVRRPSEAPRVYGFAGQRGLKAGQVHAVVESEIGGDHGAVEGGQAELIEQAKLDAGEVAIGEERLGVFANQFEVEAREQIVGAVAAAHAGDDAGVGVGECGVQIGEALLGGSGEEEWAACLGMCAELGDEAE